MLETLEELGFVTSENGCFDNQDKVILLHIYKSKLNGDKIDFAQIAQDINAGKSVSDEEFYSKIRTAHKVLAEKRSNEIDNEKLGSSRLFEKFEERLKTIQDAFQDKKVQFEAMQELLNNQDSLDAFCQKTNMSGNKDVVKNALSKKFEEMKPDYLKSKINCISVGVDYSAWVDARTGKYSRVLA